MKAKKGKFFFAYLLNILIICHVVRAADTPRDTRGAAGTCARGEMD
jgi:hypothetical protein